ncbi:MAG TPA: virginiamycin B lyase, partial [Pseudonocardiaceae bacterium]|nr:virginiamycin B lyase [Pseudonocardiaceae bacterium]
MTFNQFEVPDAGSGPYAITVGPDGALWFTLVHSGGIGRSTPAGDLTVHPLKSDSGPTVITTGPDDALWFTAYQGHWLGRISTDGTVTEFSLPTPQA